MPIPQVNITHQFIPFFFVFIALEVLWGLWRHRNTYHWQDSLANLSCGALQQILELFAKAGIVGGYLWLYEQARLQTLPLDAAWAWVACMLAVDFGYYWFHRASHRINLIWIGHGPHHQSEEFNLTVALRQGAFERFYSGLFWLPLAVLGFPPIMYLSCVQLMEIYQFFIHTRHIGQLGSLEWVLNTPSHHRVHHGKTPSYIDKNYGGILIIWDRLFGSFAPEHEAPVYGIVTPLRSWNPLWANLHYFGDLLQQSRQLPHPADKLRLWFKPPGWRPDRPAPEIPAVQADTIVKYRTSGSFGLNTLVLLQFLAVLLASTLLLEGAPYLPPLFLAALAALLSLGFVALSGLLEQRPWRRWAEGLFVLGALLATAQLGTLF
ncbi:MAG: sterol desaturase family protein [Candidatus Sericytochromatia bacterium]|nr:sterol desaturase family protein [Candidatus Sericytochromatia bacterium]